MNSKVQEIKKRIEEKEKEVLMHKEVFKIIKEINHAKSKVIEYHNLMKKSTFSDDHSNYYGLCEDYMELCQALMEHLRDTFAKYDYIDQEECKELLMICYDFEFFNGAIIWNYLD